MLTNSNTTSNTESTVRSNFDAYTDRQQYDTPVHNRLMRGSNDNWCLSSERLALAILSDLTMFHYISTTVFADREIDNLVLHIVATIYRVMPLLDRAELMRLNDSEIEDSTDAPKTQPTDRAAMIARLTPGQLEAVERFITSAQAAETAETAQCDESAPTLALYSRVRITRTNDTHQGETGAIVEILPPYPDDGIGTGYEVYFGGGRYCTYEAQHLEIVKQQM